MTHPGLAALVALSNPVANRANPLYALLAPVDLFLVWNLFLATMGVAAVSGLSRSKSAALVVLSWAVITMVGFLPGWAGRALMPGGGA